MRSRLAAPVSRCKLESWAQRRECGRSRYAGDTTTDNDGTAAVVWLLLTHHAGVPLFSMLPLCAVQARFDRMRSDYPAMARFLYFPSWLHLCHADWMLPSLLTAGAAIGLGLVWSSLASRTGLVVMWSIYLSFASVLNLRSAVRTTSATCARTMLGLLLPSLFLTSLLLLCSVCLCSRTICFWRWASSVCSSPRWTPAHGASPRRPCRC